MPMVYDTFIPYNEWTNLRTASGIALDKPLIITAKSPYVTIWEGDAAPVDTNGDSRHGTELFRGQTPWLVAANQPVFGLFSDPGQTTRGRLSVQEYTGS
jgi:hypothetical protein